MVGGADSTAHNLHDQRCDSAHLWASRKLGLGMIEGERGRAPGRSLLDDPPPAASTAPHRGRVAKWRLGWPWSEAERRRYLDDLRGRPVNFSTPLEEMTPERGWTADG